MKMAKSTYYFELNRVDAVAEKNRDLLSEIKKIFHENKGIYGVRRIYQELCRIIGSFVLVGYSQVF